MYTILMYFFFIYRFYFRLHHYIKPWLQGKREKELPTNNSAINEKDGENEPPIKKQKLSESGSLSFI